METWKPIAAADGYEVSDHGRVRSWRRWGGNGGNAGGGRVSTPRLLSLKTDRYGYRVASLMVDSRLRFFTVHRLVALAFIGEPPPGQNEVRHLDGNPQNNTVGNLAWGSGAENGRDKVQHGRSLKGTAYPLAKLTDESVRALWAMRAEGFTHKKIAERLAVSKGAVGRVLRGEGWTHVTRVES